MPHDYTGVGGNHYCSMPGCPKTTGHCPLCQPMQPLYNLPPAPQFHPPGCICPPTSEKTCENSFCPRKTLRISVGGVTISSTDLGSGK